MQALTHSTLADVVAKVVHEQPVLDLHTHLYPPSFGTPVPHRGEPIDPHGLCLWGLDELLTYHYLIAEVFRVVPAEVLPYEQFWAMSKQDQADHIWKHLFVERTPLSEACRGVVTTLTNLGLDPNVKSLASLRTWFREQVPNAYIDRIMELANVSTITMTNAVFDPNERQRWLNGIPLDSRFRGVLRFDPLLLDWPSAAEQMRAWGYTLGDDFSEETLREVRRFLHDWCDRVQAAYCAVSLPPDFHYPDFDACDTLLAKCVLPVCAERGIAFAMMIGSKRGVNPALRDAGDMGGLADVQSVCRLCEEFPHNRFLVTMLARENQHELAVAARKFGNLTPFGCWWFLNIPSQIEAMTMLRLELLGSSFIPQHSDARVLDQLVYKWGHSRAVLAKCLTQHYAALLDAGWHLNELAIAKDVSLLFHGNTADVMSIKPKQA